MTFRIELTIPCLPDPDLSSNRRRNRAWQAQARDTATERGRAAALLMVSKYETGESWDYLPRSIRLDWTLHWPKGTRSRDADSLAAMLKPWQDAMIDLGWLVNDSPKYVPTVSYTSVPSSPKGPSMELEIRQVED